MPVWITIGAGVTLGLSALVSFALGAIFATIGREIGELFRDGGVDDRSSVPEQGRPPKP